MGSKSAGIHADNRAYLKCWKCGAIYRVAREKAGIGPVKAKCKCGEAIAGEIYDCPKCGARQLKHEECIECGVIFRKLEEARRVPMVEIKASDQIKRARPISIFGLVGSIVLMVGAFSPIFHAPVLGSINYFRNGEGDGAIILVLALGALLFTIARSSFWYIRGLGVACVVIVSYDLFSLMRRIHEHGNAIPESVKTSVFGNLTKAMLASVQIEWGWVLLFAGSLLLVFVGILDEKLFGNVGLPK